MRFYITSYIYRYYNICDAVFRRLTVNIPVSGWGDRNCRRVARRVPTEFSKDIMTLIKCLLFFYFVSSSPSFDYYLFIIVIYGRRRSVWMSKSSTYLTIVCHLYRMVQLLGILGRRRKKGGGGGGRGRGVGDGYLLHIHFASIVWTSRWAVDELQLCTMTSHNK